MRKQLRPCVTAALFALLTFATGARATVPTAMNFQGVLKDGSGDPVADGMYAVTFRMYNVPTGGTDLWLENQAVNTVNGLFNVVLGSLNPLPDSIFRDTACYLGVTVSPDPEMSPRQQMYAVGYAFRVASIDSARGGVLLGEVEVTGGLIRYIQRVAGYSQDNTDVGPLASRTLFFAKSKVTTGIRVTYTDNMRVLGPNAGRWEIRFNGLPCPFPGPLVFDYYEDGPGTGYMHQSQTVCAACFGAFGPSVTIQVYVGPTPGYGGADLYTGWNGSYWTLEAEEVY